MLLCLCMMARADQMRASTPPIDFVLDAVACSPKDYGDGSRAGGGLRHVGGVGQTLNLSSLYANECVVHN